MAMTDPPAKAPPPASSGSFSRPAPESTGSMTPRSQPSPSRSELRSRKLVSAQSLSEPAPLVPRVSRSRPPSTSSVAPALPDHASLSRTPSVLKATPPSSQEATLSDPKTSDPSSTSKVATELEKKKKKQKHSVKHDKVSLESLISAPSLVPTEAVGSNPPDK
ncbi:uncharacterized protein LOC129335119 [Eublepharis macularius]|uniref:Uncharacterized protein LOC129335119 n=1 Tax=Eublepharis macularius TaxID=481883 RepID=A0AA97JUU3_EUBMA|nr:uncharacterized protein LOC129335119 [Eublepharis macularius]